MMNRAYQVTLFRGGISKNIVMLALGLGDLEEEVNKKYTGWMIGNVKPYERWDVTEGVRDELLAQWRDKPAPVVAISSLSNFATITAGYSELGKD